MYNNGYIIVDCLGLYVDFEENPTQTISGLHEDFIKAIDTGKPIYVANLSLDEDAPVISPLNAKVSVDGTNVIVETQDISFVVSNADAVTPLEVTPTYPGNQRLQLIDLGTEYTAELKSDISSGKFEKALVGGYLTINNHRYYFAHADYWLHTGDTECTTHHMVVIPSGNLATGKFNSTNTTNGAYAGSDLYTGNNDNSVLATVKNIIETDFGATNILSHREYLANAVSNGNQSSGAWYDSKIDLMNERMVYGNNVFGGVCDGVTIPNLYTVDKSQLKLFNERPELITTRANWWLRDVVSSTNFAGVIGLGNANRGEASASFGIRPAFAIK